MRCKGNGKSHRFSKQLYISCQETSFVSFPELHTLLGALDLAVGLRLEVPVAPRSYSYRVSKPWLDLHGYRLDGYVYFQPRRFQ